MHGCGLARWWRPTSLFFFLKKREIFCLLRSKAGDGALLWFGTFAAFSSGSVCIMFQPTCEDREECGHGPWRGGHGLFICYVLTIFQVLSCFFFAFRHFPILIGWLFCFVLSSAISPPENLMTFTTTIHYSSSLLNMEVIIISLGFC